MIQSKMMIMITESTDGTPQIISARTRAGTVLPSEVEYAEVASQAQDIIEYIQRFEDGKDVIIEAKERQVEKLETELKTIKRTFREFNPGETYGAGETVYDVKGDRLLKITEPLDENSTAEDMERSIVVVEREE